MARKPPREKLVTRLAREQGIADLLGAERLIRAGKVRVNGERHEKPGTLIPCDSILSVDEGRGYVGRGAFKLQHALDTSQFSVRNLVCADVGSSTGGFTEVLLKAGARKVYAIDVGYGELDYKLRVDPRVVVMERTNARHIKALPEEIDFVSIDVSFISLKLILPVVRGWFRMKGAVVALIKPQFEASREEVEAGGIVRDSSVHQRVQDEIADCAQQHSFEVIQRMESPILGGDGNREFLMILTCLAR